MITSFLTMMGALISIPLGIFFHFDGYMFIYLCSIPSFFIISLPIFKYSASKNVNQYIYIVIFTFSLISTVLGMLFLIG